MRKIVSGSLLTAAGVLTPGRAADIIIAPDGNDTTGRGTPDAPYATLVRAGEAVRTLLHREPGRESPVTVALRGGTYVLAAPWRLGPEDSGTARAPVVWTAWPGEKPRISGGRRISGWQVRDGRWEVHLPEVARGEWSFCQLFVNGECRQRPRLPREGYYHIQKELPPSRTGGAPDRFGFRVGDLDPGWRNLADVEVLCFHYWGMSRLRPATVDPEAGVVSFTGPTCANSWWAGLRRGHRFLVENVREALDRPGEWYLDRASGLLTYLPLPGEDPATAEVVAPRLERLLDIRGDAKLGTWVSHIRFEGLAFAHTNWVLPEAGYSCAQAESALRGAVFASGVRDLAFHGCSIRQVATYGLDLSEGCQYVHIEDCDIRHIGAGGIRVGEGWGRGADSPETGHVTIRNNTIAQGGRLHPAGIGVWIGLSGHNLIEHNDIFDFYYSGLSVGWTWGYQPTPASHNIIRHNHVHTIGQGVLSDMGGIYTLGLSPGTRIEHNCFHDIDSFDYGGWGIYFDEGSTGIVAENNLVYRTKTGGFHQHYGRENVVRNNILAFARIGQIQRTRQEEHLMFTLERNLVLWDRGSVMHGNWAAGGFALHRNLYWHTGGEPVRFPGGLTLEEWQAKGHDEGSMVADPGFADPAAGDFRLAPDSPALALGFQPFRLDGFGRQTPTDAAEPQPLPRAFPPPPPPPPPSPIREDFELLPVGEKCFGAETHEDANVKEATARVTDERAAGGRHSLKLVDRPGQKHPWDPHLYFRPGYTAGRVTGSFDACFEGGTQFFHEWRDANAPYRVGPSVRVRPDGLLVSGERELARLPLHAWVHFAFQWSMEPGEGGRFRLDVTPAGAETITFTDLPCNPECRALHWFGFCCEGDAAGAFHLDNIRLEPQQK
ncbi:MAG: right-handed parallel beta-helix repeat-containing protein [Lentisphaeria bacterium]|nr:right-handed parallel beta-helix repeat-containing protein [Lentisphaeria bacterium]